MGIAEILAKKKAAAEAKENTNATEETQAPTTGILVESVAPAQTVHTVIETLPTATEQNNPANPGAPIQEKPAAGPVYPTHDANGKPLSGFHLIQAKKKAEAEWAMKNQGIVNVHNEIGRPSSNQDVRAVEEAKPANQSSVETSVQSTETTAPSSEAEQAYADIKPKLDALVAMSEDNLKTAMQELKKSLMQNPSAVALMLPSDIGQMVIALRKMTGVELEAAKTGAAKSKTSKKKEAILTAEQLEDAWKEL